MVKSRIRVAYIVQVVTVVVLIHIPVMLALGDDDPSYPMNLSRLIWIFGVIWISGGLIIYFRRKISFIQVDSDTIVFRTVTGRVWRYQFNEIRKIETYRERSRGSYSLGYQVMVVKFYDGKDLVISANQYANYGELKGGIYRWYGSVGILQG